MRRIATNLFQHRNGVYYARFKGAGKQHWISLRTQNVRNARAALPAALRSGVPMHPDKPAPKVALEFHGQELIAELLSQVKTELGPLVEVLKGRFLGLFLFGDVALG